MKRVPAVGPKDANIMLLGESPGHTEVQRGKPFVGRSGGLLDDTLRDIGLKRSQIYITNTVKVLPPAKDKKKFFWSKDGSPSDIYWEGILEVKEEIETVKPNVVVPLGNYALWALTQKTGITKWRGSILESSIIEGQKVIPTIHPAYYINTYRWFELPYFEWDMRRVKEESLTPEINLPNPNIIIDPTPAQVEDAIQRFTQAEILTTDTEWYAENKLAYVGFSDGPDYAVVMPADSMQRLRAIREILSSPVPKIMQNAMFDVVALHRQGIEVVNTQHDTMIAWHCCWTDLRSKGLSTITSILTKHPYYKDEVDFVGQDEEKGQIYCGTDCVSTHESWEKIDSEEFQITKGRRGYEISMSIMDPFLEASKLGILVDREKLLDTKQAYLDKAFEIEDALSKTLGYSINPRSNPQVRKLVYDDLLPAFGIKRTKRTTRQEVLMDIAASYHIEEIELILGAIVRARQNLNIVSRYIKEGIVDNDGRVRCTWNLAGTRSGRLSTTIPWWPGVALQTVPEEARDIFIADPGHVFISWDQEQAEARYVAVKTYDHDLLDAMNSGIDIHTTLASQLPFNMTYDEIMAKIEEFAKEGKSKDEVKERYLAKKSRHALNYCEGVKTFKLHINRDWLETGVGVSHREARDIREAYLELHPGLKAWWQEVQRRLRDDGYLVNAHGRHRNFIGKITDKMIREAVSFEPQSSITDHTTIAIAEMCERVDYIQPMLHMHDGGMIQAPENRRDEAIEIVRETTERPMRIGNEIITIPITVKAGYSWGSLEKVDS